MFLGVLDDGTVTGVPKKAAYDMIRNFINVICNPSLFTPTIYLAPELLEYKGHTVIHVHVPLNEDYSFGTAKQIYFYQSVKK